MFSKTQPRPSRCPRCKRCRQKKIKCDYAQPRCGHCVKAKVPCEPFKQQFLFIHAESQPSDGGKQLASRPLAKGADQAAPSLQPQPWRVATSKQYYSKERRGRQWPPAEPSMYDGEEADDLQWRVIPTRTQEYLLPTAHELTTSPMLMTGSLGRAAAFDQFLRYYLPDGPRLYAHRSSGSWLSTARSNRQRFPPLEAAACALGVLTLGRGTHDMAMQKRSFGLYGDALGFAQRFIAQARLDNENWHRVLETVNLLSLFEALAPQSKQQKTLSHVAGLSALLKMAGPSGFQEEEAHNIFLHARSAIIYTAVLLEKETFLADPAWVSEPWAYIPKANISTCLDAVVLIPTLLGLAHQIDDAVATGLDPTSLVYEFDLISARLRAMLEEGSALFVRTPPEESSGNVHDFAAIQLHHSCELFHHDAVRRLASHAEHSPLTFSRYADEVNWSLLEMEFSARTIISDINDFNTEDCGFLTANMLFLPTLAANQFLKRNNSDDEEVMNACRQTANTFIGRGFHFFQNHA
ncbi:hypothetical protein PWT90_07741 [Aphanocladium album]|nr:hypothetical protein PWT90_07741 [Aphanocladium album]